MKIMREFGRQGMQWVDNPLLDSYRIFSDKKAISLKSTALVACPAHAVLMNFIYSFRRCLIGNGRTVARYLPAKILY